MSIIGRLPILRPVIPTTFVTGDYTVKFTDQRVEIDATSGNVIITLPTITTVFKNKPNILFKRIDITSNTVTFIGTNSNYEDEGLEIGDSKVSTTKIYASNDNIWRTGEIEDNFTDNIIIVNSERDLGTPVGNVITYGSADNGKLFLLNRDVATSSRFIIEDGIIVSFKSVELKTLTYTGDGTMFTSSDFGLIIFNIMTISAPSGTLWSLSGSGQVLGVSTGFTNIAIGGVATNDFLTFLFCAFSDTGQGYIFNNNAFGVAFSEGGFQGWKNEITTKLTFTGNAMGDITIFDTGINAGSNETMFDFDQSLKIGQTSITITSTIIVKGSVGALFAPNSLDQSYVGSTFIGNPGIANSTSVVKLTLVGNTAITTIATESTNTVINSNVLYTIDSLIERFLIQDICIFDNTGNTVDTTFNHGLTNNDRVFLNSYPGSTLPAELDETTEYFVVNKNAADFQLSLTSGGAAVTFTDDGTGTLHYRHGVNSVTQLAHIIYIGNEDIKCSANGWCTLESTTGTKIDVSGTIMAIDTAGTITEDQVGSPISVNSSESGVSNLTNVATLSTGEGNVIYIRNDSDTTNIIAKDLLIGFNDVS